jgi:proteasome lid subunit RPN8/RPN11
MSQVKKTSKTDQGKPGDHLMAKKEEKVRPVLAMPIYVLVDEDCLVLPNATLEFKTPKELPPDGNYYVLTAEGLHHSKDSPIVKALTPVKDIPVLASFQSAAKLRLPKIPPLIFARAWKFFARVYKEHKSESEVMLLYNKEKRIYDLWCPKQEVSLGGVEYEMSQELADTPKEWQWVGTIHSHADFGAYHSGTDIGDEGHGNSDGVHITIGHVNHAECSVSASVAITGHRWKLPPENLLLGIVRGKGESKRYTVNVSTQNEFFNVNLSDEEQELLDGKCNEQIEKSWLPRVSKKTWGYGGGMGFHTIWEAPETTDFEEEEEDGEWQYRKGQWTFISNEQLEEEEQADAEEAEKNRQISADAGDVED